MAPKPAHSCPECEEGFLDESALARHGEVMHGAPRQKAEEGGEQRPWSFGGECI